MFLHKRKFYRKFSSKQNNTFIKYTILRRIQHKPLSRAAAGDPLQLPELCTIHIRKCKICCSAHNVL